MAMKKGQVSTEMLTVFAAVFVVLVFVLFLFSGQISTVANVKNSLDSFFIASTLGSAIDSIYLAGNGTSATLDLYQKNATLWIEGRQLNVQRGGAFYDWPLLTNSTSMQNLTFGEVKVRNSDGVVYIENA